MDNEAILESPLQLIVLIISVKRVDRFFIRQATDAVSIAVARIALVWYGKLG
jgi:hypothetical protein